MNNNDAKNDYDHIGNFLSGIISVNWPLTQLNHLLSNIFI